MRNSIVMKFLALCLAALCLLSVLGSAGCIIFMAAEDLYDESVDEYYNNAMHNTRQNYAVNLVHRYASLNLGRLPEQYLNDYYGQYWMYNTFQYGTFFYTIRNELGEIVESTMAEAPTGGKSYELVVTNLRYRVLVEILDSPDPATYPEYEYDTEEGEFWPETTEMPEDAAQTAAEYALAKGAQIHYGSYYDHDRGRMVDFSFVYEDLAPYTVELYLLPGAVPEEYAWTLLRTVWAVRYQLFWLLGGSMLLFAAFCVYLTLAAGHKKNREEVRAGGLNCIPLDLYLGAVAFCVIFAVGFGGEAMYHLLRSAPKILVPTAVLVGYLLCVLVVSFGFACAAQFKTPDGYWWRNTLIGWFFRLCYLLACWLEKFLGRKVFPALGRILAWLWQLVCRAWRFFCKACVWLYHATEKALGWFFASLGAIFRWTGSRLNRCFSLLPLMWQWLLTGAVMLIAVTFALMTRSEGMLVLSLCASFALILYGASSFGTLLEATKRMGKGDLETQVSSKNLFGSFKEFAGDLNALADVAVVAARNQLKSERMKTELITNVSHDIKTPLTSIINYVDLLQKPHTDEEQEMYLEVLSRQSGQLKKLIGDLMEMSKASTGNMAVEITAVDAVEAVNQALGEFADKLERAQLVPVFRQPEEPVYMKADGRLAWRVLSNLLSNAYKYALPGTRLYIDLMELEGKVLISLKNISREELNVSAEELLERFVRGDASRNTEGSGLGLNIAQSLMELQKGQLQLLVDGDLFKVTLVFPAARME